MGKRQNFKLSWHIEFYEKIKMMSDLFGGFLEPVKISLAGANLLYFPSIDLDLPPEQLMMKLISETVWRAENITIYGKTFPQPRLVAWFGDEGLDYTYSGIHLKPLAWTPDLLKIRGKIEKICDARFNSVLLNYYRDERDSMGFHSDNERELGKNPTIASLSLGEERTLIFKPKHDKISRPLRLSLQSGSLLIMAGDTQNNWIHGIGKMNSECGARVNLTFRYIYGKDEIL